ncbi:hypothetical protein GOBAR_AA17817 [Gossypium barbadense]|uniref:Uncharacterized protein n=1 Tax=Gossypium barbadense TaxID=3634 RepID=A0A2P5XHL9_GOSBA|nr:hypothetical protein GOBAR_AA17817 [Gossypium barbadense]
MEIDNLLLKVAEPLGFGHWPWRRERNQKAPLFMVPQVGEIPSSNSFKEGWRIPHHAILVTDSWHGRGGPPRSSWSAMEEAKMRGLKP